MTLFFIGLLGVSIVGMSTILMLKRYELSTGTVFFSSLRPRIGGFFHGLTLWVTRHLPAVVQHALVSGGARARAYMHRTVAKAIIATEFALEKALHTVKESTTVERIPGEASPFLREVADHKKKLLHRARARATIED